MTRVLALALAAALSIPGTALASKEVSGTTLRLSLSPDDPFFIVGERVTLLLDVDAASAVPGDVGLGVALPAELSLPCGDVPGDRLLIFFDVGTGGGSVCLTTWAARRSSRIAQFPGVTLPTGFRLHVELGTLDITPLISRTELVFFAYILDPLFRAVLLDATTTVLDVE